MNRGKTVVIGISTAIVSIGAAGIFVLREYDMPIPKTGWESRQIIDLSNDSQYAPVEKHLRELIKERGKENIGGLFCVVWYRFPDDNYTVGWVYWREDNALILWKPQIWPDDGLYESQRYLDIETAIVATDTGTTNFEEPLSFFGDVLHDCTTHGKIYDI